MFSVKYVFLKIKNKTRIKHNRPSLIRRFCVLRAQHEQHGHISLSASQCFWYLQHPHFHHNRHQTPDVKHSILHYQYA